jgi:tyrosine-protein phosphatase SIW14
MPQSRGLPIVVLAVLLATACATPRGSLAKAGIRNYDEVNKQLSRGAQPSSEGIKELANRGLITIINLRPESEDPTATDREKAEAQNLMQHYEPVPLSRWCAPREKDIAHILNIISDPAEQPVFVHCQRGADRTGTVVAIYRITHDCWSAEEAIREARQHGMGWWSFPMRRFIRTWYRTKRAQPCVPAPSNGVA